MIHFDSQHNQVKAEEGVKLSFLNNDFGDISKVIIHIFLTTLDTLLIQIENFHNCIDTSLKNFPTSPLFRTFTTS
jgi:hypothetical protein